MLRGIKRDLYIHERPEWPMFRWDRGRIGQRLAEVRRRQRRLFARMEKLGFQLRMEALLEILTVDVLKSSEIEGEKLDRKKVGCLIARWLGIETNGLMPAGSEVEGLVEMVLDASQLYDQPLTVKRLLDWQAALFPAGRRGISKIKIGAWRDDRRGPMQIVSGPIWNRRVCSEAPSAGRLRSEIKTFLDWFEEESTTDLVLKAGVAHLWFATIHPFEDGNGPVARAISDMALARSEGSSERFYSLSAQILEERKTYCKVLEAAQKGDLDITCWLEWFLDCLGRSFDGSETILATVLAKASFLDRFAGNDLNERQRNMLNRLLNGLDGKLTLSRWAKLEKCSQDVALRDIDDLIKKGALTKDSAGGRSASYSLAKIS